MAARRRPYSAEIGAELGEVAPERRSTHRNGYRERGWETRVGEIELLVPKKRSGPAYFPSFLEARRPAEQAIVAVVMEAYVNGVSTRKVDRLVEQLGIGGMTKDRVSAICRGLDERVAAFRERPLEGAYPYLWLDAKYVKVRDRGRVVSKALVVAYAVHETGIREVIGLDVGEVESGSFWVEFLRGLKRRGLSSVRLAITDQHEGLKAAVARVLGCPWQRCSVHFTRDMVMHCRRDQRGLVAAALREIFQAENGPAAKERVTSVLERLAPVAPKVCDLLEAAEEDLTAFYAFPREHWTKLRSTNPLERVTRRSAAAPTSSGSSPTTRPSSGSPARCSWSRTTSGWCSAATSPPSRWRSSSPNRPTRPSRPRRSHTLPPDPTRRRARACRHDPAPYGHGLAPTRASPSPRPRR